MDTAILIPFYRERIVEKEYSGLGIWETFIFIIPSRNFLFREYSISRSTNKYILSNSFADLSNISFEIQENEFHQYIWMILTNREVSAIMVVVKGNNESLDEPIVFVSHPGKPFREPAHLHQYMNGNVSNRHCIHYLLLKDLKNKS